MEAANPDKDKNKKTDSALLDIIVKYLLPRNG